MSHNDDVKEVVCLYHRDCFDGMGSAWVVRQRHPHALFRAVNYGDKDFNEILDFTAGRHVVIADYCYPLEQMLELINVAASLEVYDHHLTRKEVIEALGEMTFGDKAVHAEYNPNASGALITYMAYADAIQQHYPAEVIQKMELVAYMLSDADLYKFQLPNTVWFSAWLSSIPLDLDAWSDALRQFLIGELELSEICVIARYLRSQREVEIDRVLKQCFRKVEIAGYTVPFINCHRSIGSELSAKIYRDYDFVVFYQDTATHRALSFRSDSTGVNVREIAESFGGGGHDHASGWNAPRDHELAKV